MASTEEFDVVVFGGGSGLTIAHSADEAGKTVCVVEEGPLGGTCENRGCIPTKGIIQSAEVLHTIREAGRFGVHVDMDHVRIDFPQIMDAVRERRKERTDGARQWVESTFTLVDEHASFVAEKTLQAPSREVEGEQVFLATGASAAVPPIPGLDKTEFLTNEGVLELKEQPDDLIIVGGGYIGAEFAHFFHQVGTKVSVVESAECLLREDDDVKSLFTKEFAKYVDLFNGWRAKEVASSGGRVHMVIERDGKQKELSADALLVATGRQPNTRDLGLETTGVELNEQGFVQVDEQLRTSHDDIWAIGDVNGQQMFKHTAAYEAGVAWRNSQGAGEAVDYRANPHAIFTYPQIAAVGLTERECKDQGLDYKVATLAYDGVAKGAIVGSPPGLVKALVERTTDRILGFHMVGPHAADLIHEVVVAMVAGDGTASNVTRAIHQHPAMPELVKEAFLNVK